MTKREFVTKSGDTFEWEETEEVRKAVESTKAIRELNKSTRLWSRQMKDKTITVEDYEKYSGEFFDKYFYVAKQLVKVQQRTS